MKESVWTKRETAISIRALANAIDATELPERIFLHIKELETLARLVRTKELYQNPDWIKNQVE